MKINLIKISIFVILFYIFGVNQLFDAALEKKSLPTIRYQELFFFLLPGFYILLTAHKNKRLDFPYLASMGLFIVTFWFLETFVHKTNNFESWRDLPERFYYLILSFYFLKNLNKIYFSSVLKYVVITIIIKLILIYLSLFEILNFVEFEIWETEGNRLAGSINLNAVSDQIVLGILIMLYLVRHNIRKIQIINFNVSLFYLIAFMLPLIFLSASRGSFLLLLIILFIIYKDMLWRYRFRFILIGIFLYVLSSSSLGTIVDNVNVVKRLFDSGKSSSTGEEEARLLQVYASWQNFQNNKIFGLGYENAASNVFHGISRSNFQYTQVLAAGGLVLFFTFMNLIFRLFGSTIKMYRVNQYLLASIFYVLILFIFHRPDTYMGVLAYFVFMLKTTDNQYFILNGNSVL
jgi:O-antigen ligase